MEWINHQDPILEILGDDGSVKESIDLTQYDYDKLFALLDDKGFVRK